MVLSMLGTTSLETFIDNQKLNFLGTLCRSHHTTIVKRLFLCRLFNCHFDCTTKNVGFIPDVLRILQKYELLDYMRILIAKGEFPSKFRWKCICRQSIKSREEQALAQRFNASEDFCLYKLIQPDLCPSNLWITARLRPRALNSFFFAAYICTLSQPLVNSTCRHCFAIVDEERIHILFNCTETYTLRATYWKHIRSDFGEVLYNALCGQSVTDLLILMLGGVTGQIREQLDTEAYTDFLTMSAVYITNCYTMQ